MQKVQLKSVGLAVCAIGSFACAGAAANPVPLEDMMPVIELSGGDIALCSVRGTAKLAAASVVIEVAIRKAAKADQTEFRISAQPAGAIDGAITQASIRTASSGTTPSFKAQRTASGGLTLTGTLPPTDGALFMQQMMVTGATALLTFDGGGAPVEITFPTPAPQSVRAAYLNCAGDLFRP